MNKTKIEWCDSTLNPVVGCMRQCDYCYARKMNNRFKWIPDFSKPQFFPERLEQLKSKKSNNIFMDSMSDIEYWKDEWIEEIFTACHNAPQHNYLFLTKNAEGYENAIENYACEDRGSQDSFEFFKNFWFGVSITNQNDVHKAVELQKLDEGHRFLSIEPLHGPIQLNIKKDRCPVCGSNEIYQDNPVTSMGWAEYYCDSCGEWVSLNKNELKPSIDWVIIGAETGNRKGKVIPLKRWVNGIVRQCKEFDIPVFMKDSLVPIIGEENMLREFPDRLRRNR